MLRTRSPRPCRARAAVSAVAAALVLGAACGGGSSGSDGNASPADASADRTATTDGATRSDQSGRAGDLPTPKNGKGEITIAGTTYPFTSDSCAVGAGDTPLVDVTGKGNSGGRDYEVEIRRQQPASNFVETVKLAFSGVEAAVATHIGGAGETTFNVEDGKVAATGLAFTGAGGAPSGDGGVSATCES